MADIIGGQRNRVVVHYKNGRLLKGYTHDFSPVASQFHLISERKIDKGKTYEVRTCDLKAIFFVKTLDGNKHYREKTTFTGIGPSSLRGLKIKVEFMDGEVLRGTTLGYGKGKKGFFVIPVDPKSNNERVYVIADALRGVATGAGAEK